MNKISELEKYTRHSEPETERSAEMERSAETAFVAPEKTGVPQPVNAAVPVPPVPAVPPVPPMACTLEWTVKPRNPPPHTLQIVAYAVYALLASEFLVLAAFVLWTMAGKDIACLLVSVPCLLGMAWLFRPAMRETAPPPPPPANAARPHKPGIVERLSRIFTN
ncbi:MAG: hypothetical protein LBK99_06510 [Opitutaceae bacterium]|nr:hypothetical protein [Opitutaceae bacterium]